MNFAFMDYLIPALILVVLAVSFFKRVGVYDVFARGAGKAVEIAWGVFPFVATVMIMLQLLKASGVTAWAAGALAPVFELLGIPKELAELLLIRPFTSSGSLAVLSGIFETYGADSYISRCGASIVSSSETIFYVAAVYFSRSNAKRLMYLLPAALLASLLSAVIACLLCRVM